MLVEKIDQTGLKFHIKKIPFAVAAILLIGWSTLFTIVSGQAIINIGYVCLVLLLALIPFVILHEYLHYIVLKWKVPNGNVKIGFRCVTPYVTCSGNIPKKVFLVCQITPLFVITGVCICLSLFFPIFSFMIWCTISAHAGTCASDLFTCYKMLRKWSQFTYIKDQEDSFSLYL